MNPFVKATDEIGHGLKVAGEEVVKRVETIVSDGEKLVRVVSDGKTPSIPSWQSWVD